MYWIFKDNAKKWGLAKSGDTITHQYWGGSLDAVFHEQFHRSSRCEALARKPLWHALQMAVCPAFPEHPKIPVAASQESDTLAFPFSQVPAIWRFLASGLTATYVPGKGGPATCRPAHSTTGLKAPATRAKPSAASVDSELGAMAEGMRSHVKHL